MPWREFVLTHIGPGLLGGITTSQWRRLLRDNRYDVSPRHAVRLASITWNATLNSAAVRWENRRRDEWESLDIEPPLFVLGHWRSGTTHLHNLLALDPRFAFPNIYQCMMPGTFLGSEAFGARMMAGLLPKRRPMDNIEWNAQSPHEDEFALCIATFISPYMGWMFPSRREHYDRYLTLADATAAEVAAWRQALLLFMKKLTWKYRRPLVLKSPTHTARIRLLLEMFPQARFVHIHRHPYAVYPSSCKTFRINMEMCGLQQPRLDDLGEWVLRQYRSMHEAFFAERSLIPAGQFHELSFSDLESDPLAQLRRLYERLALPDFAAVEAPVRAYLASIAGYQKNEFAGLDDATRRRVADAARPCFAEWGYEE